jgi:integrase
VEYRVGVEFGSVDGALFSASGQRKYLHAGEAKRLLAAADKVDKPTRLFLHLLYYTGARISEGLELSPRRLDADTCRVVFRTLKRRKLVYRAVPVPKHLMRALLAHARGHEPTALLFPWSRQHGWRQIKALMKAAKIDGPQATARGLRHRFGVHAIGRQIPESAVGRWLGHANAKSTRVYTFAIGAEEHALASRMWQNNK